MYIRYLKIAILTALYIKTLFKKLIENSIF